MTELSDLIAKAADACETGVYRISMVAGIPVFQDRSPCESRIFRVPSEARLTLWNMLESFRESQGLQEGEPCTFYHEAADARPYVEFGNGAYAFLDELRDVRARVESLPLAAAA